MLGIVLWPLPSRSKNQNVNSATQRGCRLSMTRRKDGLWQQQMTVVENGRKKQKFFYGKTKKEVLEKIAAYQEASEKGDLFETVADEWWEEAEKSLAYNTTKPYKPAIQRAKAHFGDTYIRQIKPADISRFLRDFIRKTNAADKTARTQLMVINLICKYGVENGYIDINPARDVSVPKDLPKQKRLMPSAEDIKRVKESTDCIFGMFAYWLIYTGCRRGELLALTWEDVDLGRNSISISKSVYQIGNTPKIKAPKTSSGYRTLPLMAKLREKITPGKGLIFTDKDGKLLTESKYQDLWEAYQKASGVSCTAHQLRHAYATMLFENNIDPKDAQELLGHAQLSTTMDIYTEIRESRKKSIRESLLNVDITT